MAEYFYYHKCSCGVTNIIKVSIPKTDVFNVEDDRAMEDIYCTECKKQVIIPKGRYCPDENNVLIKVE